MPAARARTSLLPPVLACLLSLWLSGAASAVIIDSGDGTGNTTAPTPVDPGWDHVGTLGVFSVVYLGDGWVLTANHVGADDVTIGGIVYPYLPGSKVRLDNGTADLVMFQIGPYPALPLLPIVTAAPALGTDLILIGHGLDRGAEISWDPNGPPPPGPIDGYQWAGPWTMRWGTNHVEDYDPAPVFDTWSFSSTFDEAGSDHEAQAANGDSGGAAFAYNGSAWELAGLLYATGDYAGQPPSTSFYGQLTYAADLSVYRDEIVALVALPEPTGGLPAGVLLLLALQRRRTRRVTGSRR